MIMLNTHRRELSTNRNEIVASLRLPRCKVMLLGVAEHLLIFSQALHTAVILDIFHLIHHFIPELVLIVVYWEQWKPPVVERVFWLQSKAWYPVTEIFMYINKCSRHFIAVSEIFKMLRSNKGAPSAVKRLKTRGIRAVLGANIKTR